MIKGAQKRMIVLKTADSAVFEEAYFVLRRENNCGEGDMVTEANRIIESSGGKNKEKRSLKNMLWYAVSFGGGTAVGVGAACLLWLLA